MFDRFRQFITRIFAREASPPAPLFVGGGYDTGENVRSLSKSLGSFFFFFF